MKNIKYVIENFFTHKDFLIDAENIIGTLYTPMQIMIYILFISLVVFLAYKLSKNKNNIQKVFKILFFVLVILEISIILWDTFARKINGIDFRNGLSLYPCSLFLYMFPFIIWGKGKQKKMACGYLGTLGLIGALINIIYPYKLEYYSIISFSALHSLFYHSSMLFVLLVLLFSKEKVYYARNFKDLIYPCIPSLLLSIPANILNFSKLDSDYMYFKGYHPFAQLILPNGDTKIYVIILYLFYIISPMLFYLPSFIKENNLFKNFKLKFKY